MALHQGRVAELPTPKPGKTLPERQAVVLLLEDGDGHVLLQRRPPAGVWAGLWSLPEHADEGAARAWFESVIEGEFATGAALPAIAHGFSHYRLQLQPRRWSGVALRPQVADNDDLRWTARNALSALGLPAPIRRLLEER
jgi:A/G-specific adenine glycosylase